MNAAEKFKNLAPSVWAPLGRLIRTIDAVCRAIVNEINHFHRIPSTPQSFLTPDRKKETKGGIYLHWQPLECNKRHANAFSFEQTKDKKIKEGTEDTYLWNKAPQNQSGKS